MATSSMLVLSLIFSISFVPSTLARDFRGIICGRTSNPNACLYLDFVKSAPNTRGLARAAIEVALNKGEAVHTQLNANYRAEAEDKRLKDIYFICSKNYNDAIRDLTISQRNFDTRFRVVPFQLNDALEEIRDCNRAFSSASSDPWNFREANEEFYLLTQIAEISAELIARNNY